MRYQLIEYETGMLIATASDEDKKLYQEALQKGQQYIMRGYHGYVLKAIVQKEGK